MPTNIEIKARVADVSSLIRKAQELSNSTDGTELNQEDTFFNVTNGRLKLRETKGDPVAQLVYYERPNVSGPKVSSYMIVPVNNPAELKAALAAAIGIKGVLKKRRLLYMVGQTRVHIDQVYDLGDFMELEVVLNEGETQEYGQSIADDLMTKLDIKQTDLLTGAYMEMLLASGPSPSNGEEVNGQK